MLAGQKDLLGRMVMVLNLGDLRFLKMALPTKSDRLWAVLVNGGEVMASRDGALYNIPLEAADGGAHTRVEIIYAGGVENKGGTRSLVAPQFVDLPLNHIRWQVYVPSGLVCSDFGGNVKPERAVSGVRSFDKQSYEARNKKQRDDSLSNAREFLITGNTLAVEGNQQEARQVLEQALNWSQGERSLNEDARVQYRELVQQQAKMGLVNRRVAVRLDNNIFQGDEQQLNAGFNAGNYTAEYAQQIESQLGDVDNDALDLVAEKIVEQQVAAAGVVSAISVTMPEHGQVLTFVRELQNERGGVLEVSFSARSARRGRALAAVAPAAGIFLVMWACSALVMGLRRRK